MAFIIRNCNEQGSGYWVYFFTDEKRQLHMYASNSYVLCPVAAKEV